MKVLVFNPYSKRPPQEIVDAVREFDHCQIIHTTDYIDFTRASRACLSGETIVVFYITKKQDLLFLEKIMNSLLDVKLLICRPQNSEHLSNRIMKLHPRIITTEDIERSLHLIPKMVAGIVKEQAQ